MFSARVWGWGNRLHPHVLYIISIFPYLSVVLNDLKNIVTYIYIYIHTEGAKNCIHILRGVIYVLAASVV